MMEDEIILSAQIKCSAPKKLNFSGGCKNCPFTQRCPHDIFGEAEDITRGAYDKAKEEFMDIMIEELKSCQQKDAPDVAV